MVKKQKPFCDKNKILQIFLYTFLFLSKYLILYIVASWCPELLGLPSEDETLGDDCTVQSESMLVIPFNCKLFSCFAKSFEMTFFETKDLILL